MPIDPQSAAAIVREISELLHQPVNMMDERGVILASSDPCRIGTLHAGAVEVIAKGLEELVVDSNEQYAGTLAGINLPIVYNGEIAGVIGLTGPQEEVRLYGQIIKKMTEILLREYDVHEQEQMNNRIRTHFLNEWIFSSPASLDQSFLERGQRLGIDLTLPRRIMLLSVCNLPYYSGSPEGQRILTKIYSHIEAEVKPGLFFHTSSRMICLIPFCSDAAARELDLRLRERLKNLMENIAVASGISAPPFDTNFRKIHLLYAQAEKALSASLSTPGNRLFFYEELGMELFLAEIPPAAKTEYLRRIFKGCPQNEFSDWIVLLQAYYEENGSVEKAAAKLYLHRNTLQYRLRRLGEITGFDPRLFSNAARYELAIRFYLENKDFWDSFQ